MALNDVGDHTDDDAGLNRGVIGLGHETITRAGVGQDRPGRLKVSFRCEGKAGQPPSSGEGSMTMGGPTAFDGQYQMHTQVEGKPEQMDMTQKGRWLSADCGQIKPLRQE